MSWGCEDVRTYTGHVASAPVVVAIGSQSPAVGAAPWSALSK